MVLGLLMLALAVLQRRPFGYAWIGLVRDPRPLDPYLLALVMAGLVITYALLLRQAFRMWPRKGALAVVLSGGAVLAAIPALSPHAFSSDVFSYIMYGRISAVHYGNPMVEPPSSFQNDAEFLALVLPVYRDSVSVYGPVWNAISSGVTYVAEAFGGDVGTYIALYRLTALAALLAAVLSVWLLLGHWAPRYQLWGTLVFAWSPLTIIEASAIHNEFAMLAFIGAGLLSLQRERPAWGVAFLTLACLVKWYAVVVLFLVVVGGARRIESGQGRQWRAILILAAVSLMTAAPWYLAYGRAAESAMAPFGPGAGGPANSVASMGAFGLPRLAGLLGMSLPQQPVVEALRLAATLIACGALASLGVTAWRRRPAWPELAGMSCTAFLVITLLTPRLHPWYALPGLMLAPFASTAVRRASITFSVSVLAMYVLSGHPGIPRLVSEARGLFMTLPAVLVLIANWRSRDRGPQDEVVSAAPAEHHGPTRRTEA